MPTGSSSNSGVPPKPPSKRRNTTKPSSWGLAEPIQAGIAADQPDLGFDPHPMVARMWVALGKSVESRFYSHADWERASWELFNANELFTGARPWTPTAWAQIQSGLSQLLVSPADKRRAGIELRAAAGDPDVDAAVSIVADYHEKLAG